MATDSKKMYIHYLIALVFGLLILLAPGGNHLTKQGVYVLAISLPMLYLWVIGADMAWTSLLFLGLVIMARLMPVATVWNTSIGNANVVLVMVFLVLDGCLNETGAIKKLANWFITRNFIQGRPYAFLCMFFGANLFIGLWMQNLALAVMYLALTKKLCDQLGLEKKDKLFQVLMCGTLWGNGVLSISTPIAKFFPNLIIGWINTNLGVQITFAQWFLFGVPFVVIMFILMMIVVRLINPDVSALKKFNVAEYKKNEDPPLGMRGKIALVTMLIVILVILLPDFFIRGNLFTAGTVPHRVFSYLMGLGAVVPAVVAVGALALIRAEGKPVMDMKAGLANINIGFIFFLAATIFMGDVVNLSFPTGAETAEGVAIMGGIGPWLGSIFGPMVQGMAPFAVVMILVVLAVALTNVTTNVVVLMVFIVLGTPLMVGGISPTTLVIIMGFSIMMACATPPSVVTAALYYGPGHIKPGEVLKFNIMFLIAAIIGIAIMVPIVSAVVG